MLGRPPGKGLSACPASSCFSIVGDPRAIPSTCACPVAALLRLGYPGDLPSSKRPFFDLLADTRVTREPPGALAERSGSERWPEQAVARPGRVGPA